MSLQTLTEWLTKLLKIRNINPDGRLLFAYDLNYDEYVQLRQELADTMADADGIETLAAKSLGRARLTAPPAAFVLYAAEWWKHDYAGGVWDWGPIIESLGGGSDSFTSSPQLRSEFVARGLAFWHLSPLNKGKRFIGSVVVNGGIPMRLLAQGSGSIAVVLSQVLKLAGRYRWGQGQISQAVSERWSHLPAAYQRPEIAELLAQFVVAALQLKDEFHLEGVTDPTAQLDRVLPDWRRRFPISLRSEAAQSLLTGLVRDAANQRAVAVNGLFVAERRLVRGSGAGQYSLESHVGLPNRVPADDFASLFGLNGVEDIPRHFIIDLLAEARQSCSEGRLILGADEPIAVINTKKIASRGQAARSELQLILHSQMGDKGERFTLEGGGALSEEDPWIFVDGDAGQPVLAAVGGARLPHESVWIALPPGWTVECHTETLEVGELLCPGLVPRKILNLRANARLIQSGVVYRVLLGQVTQPRQIYQWKAQRLPEANGRAVFRDVSPPRLFRATEDGLQPVPMSAQQWRRPGNQESLVPKDARGPVEIRILDEGELVARQGIFVIPPQARIDYISGNVVGCGQVRFLNWGSIDLAPVVTTGVTAKVTTDSQSVNIALTAHSSPPSEFMVSVKWPGAVTELTLTLPYPVTGGRFLRADGSIMKAQEAVTLRNLVGMRLQIFDTNPSHPKRYEVQLILGHGKNSTSSRYPVDLLPGAGRAEVRLLDYQKQIESLLGLFDDQDATVRVLLLVGGQPSSEIRVGRYTTSLQKDENSVRVSASSLGLVSADLLDETKMLASSLIQPGADSLVLEPIRSEGVNTGAWAAEGMKPELAPWLIFPAENSGVLFRPLLWVESIRVIEDEGLCKDATEIADSDLRRAMQLAQADERRHQLHSTLVSMSANHCHESWPLLDGLWEKFHHLPLTTLDVWRMLSKQPKAMISFLLRSQLDEIELAEAIRRFRAETAWVPELTTVSDLCEVAQAFWHFWTQQGLDEKRCQKFFKDELETRLELLVNEIPSLRPLIETVIFAATGTVSQLLLEVVAVPGKKTTQNLHRQMWDGVDSLVNTQLFLVNEGREFWPRRDFVERQALPAFLEGCPSEQAHILRPHLERMFWGFGTWVKYYGTQFDARHQPDFKFSVVNLPIVCALWAATSAGRQWWGDDPGSRLALKQIRDFDPIWFEQAYRQAFKICMSIEGLVQIPRITRK